MAPKFRGGSDDWLDDEDSMGHGRGSSAQKKKNAKAPKAEALPSGDANGTIAEVFHKQCRVRLDADGSEILCTYRRASVLGHAAEESEDLRERSPVAVGDRVLVEKMSPDSGVVTGACARRNFLARPAPGRDRNETKIRHVIAANIDILVVVASVEEPRFSPGLVDRFLIAAQDSGISPVLCVSKMDLWKNGTSAPPWDIYRPLGIEVLEASARAETGISKLQQKIHGRAAVFCGHSGVGKTSLLRALLKAEIGKVGTVSDVTGKGRHTTTSAVLLNSGGDWANTAWIDTPGVKEFGLFGLNPESLVQYYPEFSSLKCSPAGCFHRDEEACEARTLERYPSYRRILESLLAGEN